MFNNQSNDERPEVASLLSNIKIAMPELNKLLSEVNIEWGFEDAFYRFYHNSFKVYYAQNYTNRIVKALRDLAPDFELKPYQIKHNPDRLDGFFNKIIELGTGKEFDSSDNSRWVEATAPVIQALFHAKYFLETVIRFGALIDQAPNLLPSGWATVLTLYRLR